MRGKSWIGLSFLLVFALAAGCGSAAAPGPRPVGNAAGPRPAGALAVNGCSGCHVSSPEPRQATPAFDSRAFLKSVAIGNH